MVEAQTWRDLLGGIISDCRERQRIADALGINPITLTRWSTGKSNPRPDNLRPLLDALPFYRTQLADLIVREFPAFFTVFTGNDKKNLLISSEFYAQVLETYTNNPTQLRSAAVCALILQQMLNRLDAQQQGMAIIIAQCIPPRDGQKIRSLRQTAWRVTHPWRSHHDYYSRFYGAESAVGHTVMTGHPVIIQTCEEKERLFPTHWTSYEESSVTYPILLADRTVGSLAIISTRPHRFTPPLLELIQSYVRLLTLAFNPHEFYGLRDIELGLMPDYTIQAPLISHFQQRVTHYLIKATQEQLQLTRPEAELMVWHELEDELLRLSYLPR